MSHYENNTSIFYNLLLYFKKKKVSFNHANS